GGFGVAAGVHGPRDGSHADAGRDSRELAADGPVTGDAAGLAVELDELAALPGAVAGGGVDGGDASRDGEQQGERVLGDGDRAHAGGVGDGDAMTCGGGEIDVVGAGAPD